MQDISNAGFTAADIERRIWSEIGKKLKEINEKSGNYIKDIVTLISKEVGINKILSIILFGSQVPNKLNESTPVSDCDLLIIFKDRVSDHHVKEIEKYFIGLEVKHGYRDDNDGLLVKILNVLQQTTGMFVSHFLTKRKYWEQARFHKIFRVNKFFSTVFAPREIVLCSVIDNSTILYGDDLRKFVKDKIEIPPFDMIKSTIMNLLISLFAIVISPIKKLKPMKYNLEAVKWALRASNYYSFEDTEKLEKLCFRFRHLEKFKLTNRHAAVYYRRFLDLRKNPRLDLGFMLRTPLRILKIHVKGLLFAKMLGKKR